MKILSGKQIREADAYTIQHEPIQSIDLMERASEACVRRIQELFPESSFAIFCGEGNNGGDGYAIARLLSDLGRSVVVYSLNVSGRKSHDCELNYDRLRLNIESKIIEISSTDLIQLKSTDVIVDALFGTGLTRPVEGFAKDLVNCLNRLHNTRVSIDVPSGLPTDSLLFPDSIAFKADFTLTFQSPKLSFLLSENLDYVGKWEVLDIGLSAEFLHELESPFFVINPEHLKKKLPRRSLSSHKGTYGHALMVAGSLGKIGAAVLSSRAALHSGTGLLTCLIPECGRTILQTAVPEAMVETQGKNEISGKILNQQYDAIGVGPGIGTDPKTKVFFLDFILSVNAPMVIDADGLNNLVGFLDKLKDTRKEVVLTPHPKEFDRLFGEHHNSIDRILTMRKACQEYGINIILKGHHTAICNSSGTVYFNTTGNPGMATAGSGDVLTGIITGLIAQSIPVFDASLLGVYLHGLSGDLAAEINSEESMVASDIIDGLKNAFKIFHE